MHELKRLFKRHIEENLLKYILVLSVFAVGILLGFVFSKNISSDLSENLKQEIGTSMDGFAEGILDKTEIFKTSFLKNLRISLLIFIGGFSVWLLPISFATFLSYGFSLGFTVGYLSLNFGAEGMGVAISSVILGFIINIPVYIILGVIAFNNVRNKKHSRGGEHSFGIYAVIFGFLFLISLISVVADAFLVPVIIGLICS